MELEDIMRDIVRMCSERGLGVPTRFRVDLHDGRTLDLPFDLVRTVSSTGPRTAPAVAQETQEPDDPPVIRAVFRLLYDANTRLTGGVVVDKLTEAHDAEPGFSTKNITRTLTALAGEGRLVSHATDPGDGLGRGYGLPEWESGE